MNRNTSYRVARAKLESAIATLIYRARNFVGDGTGTSHADLLAAGREYGRAMNRLERMRKR